MRCWWEPLPLHSPAEDLLNQRAITLAKRTENASDDRLGPSEWNYSMIKNECIIHIDNSASLAQTDLRAREIRNTPKETPMTLHVDLDLLPAYSDLIRKGGYRTTSGAKVWGIARNQFVLWLNYGQRDLDRGQLDSPYAKILRATEDAESEFEKNAHAVIDASDDWRATAWRLERRLRDTHGDIKKLQVTETAALPQAKEETVRALSGDDLRQLVQLAFGSND